MVSTMVLLLDYRAIKGATAKNNTDPKNDRLALIYILYAYYIKIKFFHKNTVALGNKKSAQFLLFNIKLGVKAYYFISWGCFYMPLTPV
jgi:hypothetical protein